MDECCHYGQLLTPFSAHPDQKIVDCKGIITALILSAGRLVAEVKENWRHLAALVCLWFSYFMCNTAYSLFAPFLPEEVHYVW
jgi:hypothetical protein